MLDVLFINPGSHKKIYQDLAKDYSAIEPPTWSLLLAQSVRSKGYKTAILDLAAEDMNEQDIIKNVCQSNPRLICFVVYGQNPNSGTVNMHGALEVSKALKENGLSSPISFVGSHVSALPLEVLENEDSIDIVFCNEGVYALWNLLSIDISDHSQLRDIKGIGYRLDGQPILTEPENVVPTERMDLDLPGSAWDLLPYNKKPLDLYRSHFWHADYKHENRTPFAALYTSLGCQFGCDFCMINIVNRNDNDPVGVASNYSNMRFWSPEFIIKEFDILFDMGVRTLRISDEMFLLNRKFYVPLCEMIYERGYGEELSMWAYSRVDTIKNPQNLELIRKAGIKWLALGIESGDKNIRLEASKGKFEDVDITKVIEMVHDADIEIIANYLFGLPGDNYDSMQQTLDLSLKLNTLAWNAYAVMALPGSSLYKQALQKGYKLPDSYLGYSFHSKDTLPLPTEHLKPYEVLEFRDKAFNIYHSNPAFLSKVEKKLGKTAKENIENLTKIKLSRDIVDNRIQLKQSD
jgi:radical SAM superfamily enzyme YgiQ (UPF0313 family)